jgi:hypothetical protein
MFHLYKKYHHQLIVIRSSSNTARVWEGKSDLFKYILRMSRNNFTTSIHLPQRDKQQKEEKEK